MNGITASEQGEVNSEGFSPVPSLIMTSALVIVMTFAVTEGLRFFLNQGSFSIWPYLFSFAVYGLCIYLTWGQRQQASMHSTTHVVARKWFWTTQLFITWHVLSIFRSIDSASTDTMIFIEELFLMIVTVFLAIWALTSKGEGSESALFARKCLVLGCSIRICLCWKCCDDYIGDGKRSVGSHRRSHSCCCHRHVSSTKYASSTSSSNEQRSRYRSVGDTTRSS